MATWQCPHQWSEWSQWLAAGLHGRCRWRLPIVLLGMLFASGRRTVASWLRAAGVGADWSNYYYFLAAVGRKAKPIATQLFYLLLRHLVKGDRVLLGLDDTSTRRYGPNVQGTGIHYNPTSAPGDAKYYYGHLWVTLAWLVRHPLWGTIGLPLRALLYVPQQQIAKLPERLGWKFSTKLQQAVALVVWAWWIVAKAGKRLWVVADGAYAKRSFLKPLRSLGIVVVSRLRKDARLFDLPRKAKKGQRRRRGRPAIYGKKRISLAKRAAAKRGWRTIECLQHNKTVTKQYKTFLATYHPAGGVIRVVIVQEPHGCQFFFCTDPSADVREILEAMADRSAIEQVFHDLKEVWGVGKQQLRSLWANVGAYHLNLWMHTLVELWAWNKPHGQICDRRGSPWDDPTRRPSHADRRNALRRTILLREYSSLLHGRGTARKLAAFVRQLLKLAV